MKLDNVVWGMEPFGLLIFFGDLSAARMGFAKVNDAQKRILERVRQGVTSADGSVQTALADARA